MADARGDEGGEPRPIAVLFDDWQAGDDNAWIELSDRLSPAIWAVVASFRLSRPASEDLAQTVWLRLVENAERIREPAALPGWIRQVARNEAVSQQRRVGREPPDLPETLAEQPSPSMDLDARVVVDAQQQAMLAGLDQIDETCRLLLRLWAHEVPYRDIAAFFDKSVGWIGPTIARCHEKVRRAPALRRWFDDSTTEEEQS